METKQGKLDFSSHKNFVFTGLAGFWSCAALAQDFLAVTGLKIGLGLGLKSFSFSGLGLGLIVQFLKRTWTWT